ncbi:MAG: S8 family serine peptidase [Flavobacteriales bacterium]|nr:S8 family serine peptidase [Flavobacteriales bacterium]
MHLKTILQGGIFTSFLLIYFTSTITAQNTSPAMEQVIRATDVARLLTMSESLTLKNRQKKTYADSMAAALGWPTLIDNEDGLYMELMEVDALGAPVYFTTDNKNAARSTNTHRVHPGGGSGLALEGQNMDIYVWDGGSVRTTHQEFGTRAVNMDASSVHFHAAHVGGTMAAAGVVANAKGMAPKATLRSYDWNNDDGEMSNRAAAGALISNHSYGTISGWLQGSSRWEWWGHEGVSPNEDYKFGFYDSRASDWDRIAYYAPYYLMVKSAGNDRGDYYSSGAYYSCGSGGSCAYRASNYSPRPGRDGGTNGYDCISTYGTAKNILTVGAVNDVTNYTSPSSVVMTSFSGWGPTDDGRIKPDLVGNGYELYSTHSSSNTSYISRSGTSMATPNVSGSLLLLQEHHKNRKGVYMRSATLKALAIHTASEAGPAPGPDYMFGWGLLNTDKATQVISDNTQFIEERVLNNSGVYEKSYKSSGAPIRVTLSWTDPEASPLSAGLNNSTLRLINDLDLRLIDDQNNTYTPYILNPLNPSGAASNGDNFRDNVEQVYLFSPTPGRYRLRVTHKGNLVRSTQAYSLIITGLNDVPPVTFTVSSKTICKGGSVVFTNTTTGYQTLSWQFVGGNVSSGTAPTQTITYANTGKFPVTLTANFGGITETKTDTITVLGLPDAGIVDPGTICKPITGLYQIYATNGGGTWNGTPWMFRTDSAIFIPNNLTEGDYRLIHSLTNAGGCTAHDTLFVKIRKNPIVTLNIFPTRYCNTIEDFALEDGRPVGGNHFINGNMDSIFSAATLGVGNHEVRYEYTDGDGCTGSATQYFIVNNCVGIAEKIENKDGSPVLQPNPTKGEFAISWPAATGFTVEVFNTAGVRIISGEDHEKKFNLAPYGSGIYLVSLRDDTGQQYTLKLVVD